MEVRRHPQRVTEAAGVRQWRPPGTAARWLGMDDDLLALRRYTRLEAAQMLCVPKTWIKDWVTARAIPMQRSGTARGVWFTRADIVAIGRMLPELMSGRQASARARQGLRARQALASARTGAGAVPVRSDLAALNAGALHPHGSVLSAEDDAGAHHPDGLPDLSGYVGLQAVRRRR